MGLSAAELAQIIWAETKKFGLARSDGQGDLNNLRRMIARIAASRGGEGFPNRVPLPAFDDTPDGATARQIGALADAAKDITSSQSHLIIWEAAADLSGLRKDGQTQLPAPWATLTAADMTQLFVTTLPNNQQIIACSHAPQADNVGAPFVSLLTGAGLSNSPVEDTDTPQKPTTDATIHSTALRKMTLLAGFMLFGAGGLMATISGLATAGARNVMTASEPSRRAAFIERIMYKCVEDQKASMSTDASSESSACRGVFAAYGLTTPAAINEAVRSDGCSVDKFLANVCQKQEVKHEVNQFEKLPVAPPDRDKLKAIKDSVSTCTALPSKVGALPSECAMLWNSAIAEYLESSGRAKYFAWWDALSKFMLGSSDAEGSISIIAPYVVSLMGAAVVLCALGLLSKGHLAGVWIDKRNRISLARVQVSLWTVLIISAFLVYGLFNVGHFAAASSAAQWAELNPFPEMSGNYWAVLGISTTSTMLSALTLATKQDPSLSLGAATSTAKPSSRLIDALGVNTSGLATKMDPADAAITDLFMGEENANHDVVDVSRLQNVLITIALVTSAFWYFVERASNLPLVDLLGNAGAVISKMPEFSGTFVELLLVSHATYLVAKMKDKPASGNNATQSPGA